MTPDVAAEGPPAKADLTAVLDALDARMRQAALIPPPTVRKQHEPLRCFACMRVWRGFGGDGRSACCGAGRNELIRLLGAHRESP